MKNSANMIEKRYIKICFISLKWVDVSEIREKLKKSLGVGVMIKSVRMSAEDKKKMFDKKNRDEELEKIPFYDRNL